MIDGYDDDCHVQERWSSVESGEASHHQKLLDQKLKEIEDKRAELKETKKKVSDVSSQSDEISRELASVQDEYARDYRTKVMLADVVVL